MRNPRTFASFNDLPVNGYIGLSLPRVDSLTCSDELFVSISVSAEKMRAAARSSAEIAVIDYNEAEWQGRLIDCIMTLVLTQRKPECRE